MFVRGSRSAGPDPWPVRTTRTLSSSKPSFAVFDRSTANRARWRIGLPYWRSLSGALEACGPSLSHVDAMAAMKKALASAKRKCHATACAERPPIGRHARSRRELGAALSNSKLVETQIHAVPGRGDDDLMDGGALWQIANQFDGLCEIIGLEHAFHVFLRWLRRSRLEDFGGDLARGNHTGANSIGAFFHVERLRHRDHGSFAGAVRRSSEPG